jgi:hypothetical protein
VDELHERLLRIGFEAGEDLGLVLAGGYALAAYDLTQRPSRDIDFATATTLPLAAVTDRLADEYRRHGYGVEVVDVSARMARLVVSSATEVCEVDLLKEAIGPPTALTVGPVLAFDDAVGLKVRALHDRSAHRDFIDVHAASTRMGPRELENLGARHTAAFSIAELAERLGAVTELDRRTFVAYGLTDEDRDRVCAWALAWETDIRARVASGDLGPSGPAESAWETYLDEQDGGSG